MSLEAVDDLMKLQDGVISRAQLLAGEISQARIDTLLRRRDLVMLHPGVYLTHTGKPGWSQRAWAAVLYAGGSALHLESALHRPGKDDPPSGPIDIAVDWSRKVKPRRGVTVHRVRDLEDKVQWNLSPPRVRVEVAALEIAHRAPDDLAAISALATVVGARRTVATRLRVTLEGRARLRRRSLLTDLVDDLERGTHSVLEHGFLDRVIRPHGLPEPSGQQAERAGRAGREYRDIVYADLDTTIELDGRTHDTSEARDEDADRDLDDLADGQIIPRLRYRQVFGTPCRTALKVAQVFEVRGWGGKAKACEDPACDLRGASS